MSKGMKQKTAIVAALMANPPIIILDEPTTGLDPLMRQAFVDIIKEEHAKGKTIFMSSHMFEEVSDTCDRVALISDGHLIDSVSISDIENRPVQEFKIEFKKPEDYSASTTRNIRLSVNRSLPASDDQHPAERDCLPL
jgi:ABC-2 type transport system ATP-binding protein